MHHVYGENWSEFKRVALEFQQAFIAEDRWGVASLCAMPLLYDILDYRGADYIGVSYFNRPLSKLIYQDPNYINQQLN